VHKSGAKFDPEKTKWFQAHYLQKTDNEILAKDFLKILENKGVTATLEYTTSVIALLKERAIFVTDFWELGSYFFVSPTSYDEKALKKAWKEDTAEIIEKLIQLVSETSDYTKENVQDNIKGWITSNEIGFGKVMQPFRIALVGSLQGPDVFDISAFIGKEETVKRLQSLLAKQ
jgi:glutamyl-tRNA synthetase